MTFKDLIKIYPVRSFVYSRVSTEDFRKELYLFETSNGVYEK
jgi:hypothetical protein